MGTTEIPGTTSPGPVRYTTRPVEVQPHHAAHIVGLEAPRQLPVLHVVAHGIVHLRLLQMELRQREPVEIADVVIVHMREDHVLDISRIDADQRQRIDR